VLALFALLWLLTQPRPFLTATQSAETARGAPITPAPPEPVPARPDQAADPVPPAEPPPAPPPVSPREDESPAPTPSPTETLRPEELALVVKRVRCALDEERVFLDPDLSLVALAARAKTTRHKLSAALRHGFGATFHQLISRYRVTEAARVLDTAEGRARTIADVAFGSGFNTLSAFNAAFRAHFGLTPSAYRDRQRAARPGE
jgi:AraC-like DNA-binding protein